MLGGIGCAPCHASLPRGRAHTLLGSRLDATEHSDELPTFAAVVIVRVTAETIHDIQREPAREGREHDHEYEPELPLTRRAATAPPQNHARYDGVRDCEPKEPG